MESDELDFLDDDEQSEADDDCWKVLIVDDEPSVHEVTKMALNKSRFENKNLSFISAYSGKEARQLLSENKDIALILLDVVMETDDQGLQIVKFIRDEQQNKMVRIILRTGQPGQMPEERIVNEYDINDYKEKNELVYEKLYTTVVNSIRSYRDLVIIDRQNQFLKVINDILNLPLQSSSFASIFAEALNKLTSSNLLPVSDHGLIYEFDGQNNEFTLIANHNMEDRDRSPLTIKKVEDLHIIENHLLIKLLANEALIGVVVLFKEGAASPPLDPPIYSAIAHNFSNILQRKNAELEKNRLQSQLIQSSKLATVGTIISGIIHELSTPSTVLSGFIKRLGSHVKKSPTSDEYLENMKQASNRILTVVKQLRSFIRKSTDEDFKAINLQDPIKNALNLQRTQMVDIEVQLNFNLPDATIWGELSQLETIFFNFLSNSIDAYIENSITTSKLITFSTEKEADDKVRIIYQDNAGGLSPETLEKVFHPFYTTKKAGKGTGLGMSVTKEIITKLKGSIAVATKEGEGTKFTIELPLYKS